MRKQVRLTAAGTVAAVGVSALLAMPATASDSGRSRCSDVDQSRRPSLDVVGLTSDQRLVCFNEFKPGKATTIGWVAGLSGGDSTLIGIDYRVQDGGLYGVGDAGGIYLLDVATATATAVSRLTVALDGTSFGVDFNPVADRLRLVSDTGQNLRHNVNVGGTTATDTALNYTTGVTALGVAGAAYTNNDLDTTTNTTLYNLDPNLDQISVQSPPNNGSLVANGKLTVDATTTAGFDTHSTLRNGVTVAVHSLAAIKTADGVTKLYSINVPTGKASELGKFDDEDTLVDIAIPLNQL